MRVGGVVAVGRGRREEEEEEEEEEQGEEEKEVDYLIKALRRR